MAYDLRHSTFEEGLNLKDNTEGPFSHFIYTVPHYYTLYFSVLVVLVMQTLPSRMSQDPLEMYRTN